MYENEEHSKEGGKLLANTVVGCKAKSPQMQALLDYLPQRIEQKRNAPTWQSTGPLYLYDMHSQGKAIFTVLPSYLFYPQYKKLSPGEFEQRLERAYAVHDWQVISQT